ncbi:MAG: DUF4249 domain-containing protein [Bacteroidales bacterium]
MQQPVLGKTTWIYKLGIIHQTQDLFIFLVLVMLNYSCIKPFHPEINSLDANKYVVSGQITDLDSKQKVTISRTSSLNQPEFIPVKNCLVKIIDDKGHEFLLQDELNGDYTGYIDTALVAPGTSFRVDILTADGITIVSDFERVSTSPPVDSIYYTLKSIPTPDPNIYRHGIQYYIDLNGTEANSRYYRWEAIETYEYHAPYPLIWYYDGSVHQIWPPDSSRMVCWRTVLVPATFTLSTSNLSENKYISLPLHFVDNKSPRLCYGYSLLVHQYALSEDAYIFWDKMRENSSGQGGLYEKQPMAIKGNMHNITHPEEEVLGFFGASKVTSKRIYTAPVSGLGFDFSNFCSPETLFNGFKDISPYEYPAGLVGDKDSYKPLVMQRECYNCTTLGGTIVKPDFWPHK